MRSLKKWEEWEIIPTFSAEVTGDINVQKWNEDGEFSSGHAAPWVSMRRHGVDS
jgi:hypothetical protein